MKTNKQLYAEHCDIEKNIPLFSQAWWLDTVCDNNWDVCLVTKGEEIVASMPYYSKKKKWFITIVQPQFTQTLGPWIKSSQTKYSKKLGQQKKIYQQLISQLPKYDYFNQNWHYSITNWLPFYWTGFSQTTRYTYVIEDLTDMNRVWAGMRSNAKGDIRKAEKKVTINHDATIDEFIALMELTYKRQGRKIPNSAENIRNVYVSALSRSHAKLFIAKDESGENHAGVFIVWDENEAYYLMGGGDPNLRNSGATSLCMWEAIKFSSTVTKTFNFEGSMIEPIERFFRSFGAVQKTYFNINKYTSKLLHVVVFTKKIFSS